MPKFEVAHLHEQGQDIVIVVVDHMFGYKSGKDQNDITQWLEGCATSAGLRGTVVPVWDAGGGTIGFLAPRPWHAFFRGMTLSDVAANINGELTCG